MTLVIMAAGMGSRFGGLKQIEPVGPNDEIIADYSVYDAKRAGFDKVIFVIRQENEEYFKDSIISKYEGIKVELAFEEFDTLPKNAEIPEGRVKMLGTGHAVYSAKDQIEGDFVIINSDDFYGYNSFKIAADFLKESNKDYISVNYPYEVTRSEFGKVKRGVIEEENKIVKNIIESEIREENGSIIAKVLQTGEEFIIKKDTPVAVNFFGVRHDFLKLLEEEFIKFIDNGLTMDNEFFLPDIIKLGIKKGIFNVYCGVSSGKWMGMTYKEDLVNVKNHISELIKKGEYPEKLWK